ncbi:fasciclin domain-containing protein [Niastella sp. OAS944]|uniref:fasciclin domain-containing protein n=1 Tax=Niastella sp. OAS944 TaxID=2664089 RepID=UPI003488125D|nr:putative surface protein with fasciclin (FAS1) repeats [Chitinophagaceae bacterium OAS944]
MKKYIYIPLVVFIAVAALFGNCKKTDLRETTTQDPNILDYLQKDSLQRFTKLLAVIEKTGYSSAMNTYGTYTLFAPTDEAIIIYLKKLNVASIDQLKDSDLKAIIQFHLLEDVVQTSEFTDGKLPSVTMLGQFLITGVVNEGGVSSYRINRQANVAQPNVLTGNGIVHVIDNVLTPSVYTVAKLVEQSSAYSVFTEALKETGYYDSLNSVKNTDGTQRWFTLLAETDQALSDAGFASYAALKKKYCNTGDPKNPADSLHLYVAYHILPDVKYLADIVMASSHETKVPLEVITDKLIDGKKVLINDDEYTTLTGPVHEIGAELDQANSDVSATNGVVHRALSHLAIKVRKPFPVYWDLCSTVSELTRLSSIYRKKTYLFDYGDGATLKDIKWEKSCLKYRNGVTGYLGDYWQVGMGTSSSNTDGLGQCAGNSWIEFTTPMLVKGKYKVWFCYFQQNGDKVINVQGSFDSIPLTSALIQFHQKIASVTDTAGMEALGWKWWAGASKRAGTTASRMLGIIDVKATGRHKIRFNLISGTNSDCNFDMIHFIPVDENQTGRRFNPDGSIEVTPH